MIAVFITEMFILFIHVIIIIIIVYNYINNYPSSYPKAVFNVDDNNNDNDNNNSARFRKVSVTKSSLTVALVTFVFSVADQCRQPVKKKRGISITDNLHVK